MPNIINKSYNESVDMARTFEKIIIIFIFCFSVFDGVSKVRISISKTVKMFTTLKHDELSTVINISNIFYLMRTSKTKAVSQ